MTGFVTPERSMARTMSHLGPHGFRSLAVTHPGCVRKLNEDSCLDRPDIGLWAVADGMGGHDAGNIASATVVNALERVTEFASAFAFRRAVRTALLEANADLQRKAEDELLDAIGSTVVALLAHRGYYACMWAGDSRAYVLRRGELERISRDHSLVQELVDAGALSASDAQRHKDAHVITRAVGARARLDLDGVYGRIEPGDRYLLCSDGLGILPESEIEAQLRLPSLAAASSSLLRCALDRGAPDNVTFVLIEAAA
jgi:serine/threonine protein phosphatase Stp1